MVLRRGQETCSFVWLLLKTALGGEPEGPGMHDDMKEEEEHSFVLGQGWAFCPQESVKEKVLLIVQTVMLVGCC